MIRLTPLTSPALALLCLLSAVAIAAEPPTPSAAPATTPSTGATDPAKPVASPSPAPETPPMPTQVKAEALGDVRPGVIVHTKLPGGRPFSLYVPKAYDKSRPWPLLVELTGRGIGRDNITHIWQVADAFQTIVVAPDTYAIFGKPGADVKVTETREAWSRSGKTLDVPLTTRDLPDFLRDLKADAEAIAATVDLLRKSLTVERELVVLTGYSGGAWVAYYAGCSDPARYAGICVRSGTFHPGIMPPNPARALKLPITLVLGDKDLDLVLADTAKAEEYFKRLKFEHFQVERLPHSGHDNRPEAAGNFVRYLEQELKARRLAEARKRWEIFFKAGQEALARGETDKARQWLQKAAEVEAAAGLPPEAAELLKKLDTPAAGTP